MIAATQVSGKSTPAAFSSLTGDGERERERINLGNSPCRSDGQAVRTEWRDKTNIILTYVTF